jgi:YVTN family beta-propeller protein
MAVFLSAQSGKTYRVKKVGEYPNFMALSPDGNTAYVTSFGTGDLIVVDLATKTVTGSVPVGSEPLGVALAEGGKTAFVACRQSGTIAVVDLAALRVVENIKVSGAPYAVAVGPKGYRVYVTNYGRTKEGGQLHVIDVR